MVSHKRDYCNIILLFIITDFSHFNHKNREACTSVVPKVGVVR